MGRARATLTLGEGAEREGKGRRPLRGAREGKGAGAPEAEGSSEPPTQATGPPGNQHMVLPDSSGRCLGTHHPSDRLIVWGQQPSGSHVETAVGKQEKQGP